MADTAIKTEEEKKEYFDAPEVLEEKTNLLVEMIKASEHFVAFTGAGISTSSGIPDYRSGYDTVLPTGPGCWETAANQQKYAAAAKNCPAVAKKGPTAAKKGPTAAKKGLAAATMKDAASQNQPANQETLRSSILTAYPSITHMALVELTERKHLKLIVSQNVDGLHRKSGIPAANIAELHGNTNLEICEDCDREYLRDHRVRVAEKFTEHRTGRKCESPGCDGFLKDNIINFGEKLNSSVLQLGGSNCQNADLCLAMGSSLRVSPANNMPIACVVNGGKLVICNLQKTPLDMFATLVIHAKCDDVMKMVMEKLSYQIPVWQMKKRIEVKLLENGAKVQLRGVDDTHQSFHLFEKISVEGLVAANVTKVFPSTQQKKQPYTFDLAAGKSRTSDFHLNLYFMGHYHEKSLRLTINMEELTAHTCIVYEMVFDSRSGDWERVVMQDQDRNMVGAANFTQK